MKGDKPHAWAAQTACRRSELVALTDKDLTDDPKGLIVYVARSKVDQTGAGRDVGVSLPERSERVRGASPFGLGLSWSSDAAQRERPPP